MLDFLVFDSPEALNMMQDEHNKVIISLLEKHGRDPKVLDVLCSLCVSNFVAVRSSQNKICDILLPGNNLLQMSLDHDASIRPNIFVGRVEGSAVYQKWYFTMDHIEQTTHMMPHLRIGWANNTGYVPYTGDGERWVETASVTICTRMDFTVSTSSLPEGRLGWSMWTLRSLTSRRVT